MQFNISKHTTKKMELNNISNCERQIRTQKQEKNIGLHLEEEVSVWAPD